MVSVRDVDCEVRGHSCLSQCLLTVSCPAGGFGNIWPPVGIGRLS